MNFGFVASEQEIPPPAKGERPL